MSESSVLIQELSNRAQVDRDRCSALERTNEKLIQAQMDAQAEAIEAENLLSAVLLTLDGIKRAELKHGRALTDAWGHHWERQKNEQKST